MKQQSLYKVNYVDKVSKAINMGTNEVREVVEQANPYMLSNKELLMTVNRLSSVWLSIIDDIENSNTKSSQDY